IRIRAIEKDDAGTEATMAKVAEKRREDERQRVRREALGHPRVQDAMQIFPEAADHVQVRIED
ncbi:MAG: hypothetical protein ACOC9O_01935, partial [Myxococcota bacterium]